MSYDYIDNTGAIVPDTTTLNDEVVTEWRDAFGADIAVTPDTPQGVMITAETLAREAVVNNNAKLANQINPNLSGGVWLDAICGLMGIERRPAKKSNVVATLFGSSGTIVPAGALAQSTAGDVWALRHAVQIQAGQASGVFECVDEGPVACGPGELNEAKDMVLGWDAITNAEAATIGSLEESDAELANRRTVTLARQGISTREAQISGLHDLDGVSSVAFRENVASSFQNIDGVTMKPHSIWACVDGGLDVDIARSLVKNKTDGAAYNGSVVVPVTDEWSGQIYQVQFERPTYKDVYVIVTMKQGREQANPIEAVPQAIHKWSRGAIPQDSGLPIGQSVSAYEVAGAINYYNPGYIVTNILLSSPQAPGQGPTTIPIAIWERAIIEPQYVQVTVID